jgi:hypothetical protein
MSYLETAESFRGIAPIHVGISYVASELAGPQGLGIGPDLFFVSLDNQLHPSIRQIANVSRHFISASNFARGVPKPNPVHSPCV